MRTMHRELSRLSVSDAVFRALDQVRERVSLIDIDYRYRYTNRANAEFYGLQPEDFVGQHLTDRIGEERFRTRAKPAFDRCFAGETVTYSHDLQLDDGRVIWLSAEMQPYRDATGGITGAIVTMRDITEETEQRRQLARDKEELTRLVADLETARAKASELAEQVRLFSYVAYHDLQEPLRKARIFADIGLKAVASEDCVLVERTLKVIDSAARQGQSLVSGLLHHVRQRDQGVERVPVCPCTIAAEVTARAAENAPERAVIAIEGERFRVLADPVLFAQALENLVLNAFKFRKADTDLRLVVETARETDGGGRIRVVDNGIGFDARHSGEIVEPFRRIDQYGGAQGFGLGLALTAGIVRAFGWTLLIDSTPGVGSRFTIAVPAAHVVAAA